jgi:hypothetical protein
VLVPSVGAKPATVSIAATAFDTIRAFKVVVAGCAIRRGGSGHLTQSTEVVKNLRIGRAGVIELYHGCGIWITASVRCKQGSTVMRHITSPHARTSNQEGFCTPLTDGH